MSHVCSNLKQKIIAIPYIVTELNRSGRQAEHSQRCLKKRRKPRRSVQSNPDTSATLPSAVSSHAELVEPVKGSGTLVACSASDTTNQDSSG
ncbi:uncharacterized protein FFUJ_03833 [Fusarium fujikuroi IMI 58289]|uniref:Uncharacterized protein n=1 Tax=Gibberella fujikuroi (strain CBS 195.34 / IMI 58289 / NRRL A-6831) TaxID=1279085 RepID=S0DR26_GIBF5|nr:uncharacterized protein FFUJ_03833 [Fusarium fujikuroi IMI 58289]CCT64905.1 uncharacterized protein FFUJ_03833 [Fusarium fujikuroi IMI 58289]SCN89997.1 uncharacterized protein FFM5_04848 [Fusarium fujikuroi]SCO36252.1 uncharacterized protein FFMR_04003 [Fusarium fujikuroi]